jgi:CRISPR/Cas system-associated protein Csx1
MLEKWILIAPWGDLTGWRRVTYIVPKIPPQGCRDLWKGGDIDHGSGGTSIESQSSSAAIAIYMR